MKSKTKCSFKVGDRVIGIVTDSFSFNRSFTVDGVCGKSITVKPDKAIIETADNGMEYYSDYKLRLLTKLDEAMK